MEMGWAKRRAFLLIAGGLAVLSLCAVAAWAQTDRASLKSDVCYQVLTDRFFDGDSTNNDPAKSPGLYDGTKSNWRLYWGGDFEGLRQKLGYLVGLGVTALWVSPPVDNIDKAAVYSGVPNAGYHGYWARDFKLPEEHFGTWTDWSNLVADARANGIKVIVDFAPNHTSPVDPNDPNFAEKGALYDNGTFVADYLNDTGWYWNHNGSISDWNNRFQLQYANLFDLADLRQESAFVDGYLRDSIKLWLDRGADGIRVDAVKHMPWWWQKSWADTVYAHKDLFIFGEWATTGPGDGLWGDYVRFTNQMGMSTLDFHLNETIRNVLARNTQTMRDLHNAIVRLDQFIKYKENLVTFIDNHDMPRFLSVLNNRTRMHQALAFTLTVRGLPCVFYGTEQYLHNDTNGGGDPYNRPMMSSWDTTTTAYRLIRKLADLKATQPALQYGSHRERWLNDDVYIYERQFFGDVALVAINRNLTSGFSISGLLTNLPQGTYGDYLEGLLGGVGITVGSGSSDRPVNTFNLPAGSVSIWHFKASEPAAPQIGSVAPVLTRPGNTVVIQGRGFGTATGSVMFDSATASIVSWSQNKIVVKAPSVAAGIRKVKVTSSNGNASNLYDVEVLSGNQVPVVFKVKGCQTVMGQNCYLTGNVWELGNWSTSATQAIGPMHPKDYPDWFVTASVPACATVEFKFIKIDGSGNVTWEGGSNHSYTVPCSGTGFVEVQWQP